MVIFTKSRCKKNKAFSKRIKFNKVYINRNIHVRLCCIIRSKSETKE